MPRSLGEQVVVITGASSGIGRAAALEFGRRGAAVVLGARNEVALRAAVEEIQRSGGRALAIITDVAEYDQVERLAAQAVDQFGRIDTWVNNAAVVEYATFEQTTVAEFDRILRVNLMGQVHGAKAVLPILQRQGGGTIINVASVESDRAVPYHAAYSASKHGIKAFTEALRVELKHEGSPVEVVLIKPGSINTPLFVHSRTKLGEVKPLPMPPIYDPAIVSETILYAAEHPRREYYVGGSAKFLSVMERLSPALADWFILQNGRGFRMQHSELSDDERDNLFQTINGRGSVRGDFTDRSHSTSLYTRTVERHPGLTMLVLGGVALGALVVMGRRRPSERTRGGVLSSIL